MYFHFSLCVKGENVSLLFQIKLKSIFSRDLVSTHMRVKDTQFPHRDDFTALQYALLQVTRGNVYLLVGDLLVESF